MNTEKKHNEIDLNEREEGIKEIRVKWKFCQFVVNQSFDEPNRTNFQYYIDEEHALDGSCAFLKQ